MHVRQMKRQERIRLGLPDGRIIDIKVLQVDRGKVRIGIDAPRDVVIVHRREKSGVKPPSEDEDGNET